MKVRSLQGFEGSLIIAASLVAYSVVNNNVAHAQGADLASVIGEPGYTNTTASKDGNQLCERGSNAAARWFADQAIGKDLLADAHRLAGSTRSPYQLPAEAIGPHQELNMGTHYRCSTMVRVDNVLSTNVTYYVAHLTNSAGSFILRSFDMSSATPTKANARISDNTFQVTYHYQDGRDETVSFREALRRYAVKMQAIAQQKQQEADRLASEANRLAIIARQERTNAQIAMQQQARRNQVKGRIAQKIQTAMSSWKRVPCEARGGTWGMTVEEYAIFDSGVEEILTDEATWQDIDAAIVLYGPKCRFIIGQ